MTVSLASEGCRKVLCVFFDAQPSPNQPFSQLVLQESRPVGSSPEGRLGSLDWIRGCHSRTCAIYQQPLFVPGTHHTLSLTIGVMV